MGYSQPWQPSDVEKAKAVLGSGRFASVEAACPDIAAALGKPGLTPSSVLRGFRKLGEKGPPSRFLKVALPTADRSHIMRVAPEPFPLNPNGRTTFVISDMHVPYHDPVVWATKLAIIKRLQPENVVIIGDYWDCYSASRFVKDPGRKLQLFEEIEVGVRMLDELEALRVPNVVFVEGNHETRIQRLVAERAPELHGMVKTIRELARINERGWRWVEYKSSIAIGKMRYSHDFNRCGVNAARQSLVDVGKCITIGHTHRLGVAYQGTIEDGSHVALNVGWGGLLSAVDYKHKDMARRDFQHGCGIVDEDERGYVWPQAVAILEGTARVRGQKVAA